MLRLVETDQKIGGIASDAVLSTEGQSVTLIYVDGTKVGKTYKILQNI